MTEHTNRLEKLFSVSENDLILHSNHMWVEFVFSAILDLTVVIHTIELIISNLNIYKSIYIIAHWNYIYSKSSQITSYCIHNVHYKILWFCSINITQILLCKYMIPYKIYMIILFS